MTSTDDRQELREAAARLVLDDVEATERLFLERRLATDAGFADEVARLRATLDLLPHGASTPPPAALRARVLREAKRRREAAPRRRGTARRLPWSTLAAIAASLVAVVLAFDAARVRRELSLERDVTKMLVEPNVVLSFQLAGTGEGAGSFGRVSLDLDGKKGAIAIQKLSPLAPDKIYALWAKVADQDVPCGQFRVDPSGRAITQFPVPVDSYTAPVAKLFVTIETGKSAPPTPSGPVVMESV
jgi:anti-sigma-K factor RskA